MTSAEMAPSWGQHFEHAVLRTVVLPNRKALFVPVPKAGCTSLLWLIAEIAGFKEARFHRSSGREVSQEMTVHDVNLWGARFLWKDLSPQARDEIAADDSWFRFTTVRNPASRLWSAWQSKLLLRESPFVQRFGTSRWFPRVPESPDDVLEDFRRFVEALSQPVESRPVDVHWAPQTDILQPAPPLTFVGRVESMTETTDTLRDVLGPVADRFRPRRENSSLLRYDPAMFDEASVDAINTLYARDFEEFGYPLLQHRPADLADWRAHTGSMLPAIEALISRHQRLGRLNDIVDSVKATVRELGDQPDEADVRA